MVDKNPFADPAFGSGADANPFGNPDFGKPASAIRQLADKALAFGSGAVGATKALADVAGAGNPVSNVLDRVDKGAQALMSEQAQDDSRQQQTIMDAANGQGVWEGVKAGARAFGVAPVQTAVQGLGSIVPTVAAGLATGGASVPASIAAMAGIGAAQGAGSIKGSIYDDVKRRQIEAVMSPQDAEAAAVKAQEFSGPNSGSIALGAGLGAVDAATGVSKAATSVIRGLARQTTISEGSTRGIVGRTALGVAGEVPLEAAQGGQQQYATNIAAGREGFKVDPMEGVAAQATMEGLASAGPGGVFGALNKAPAPVIPAKPAGPIERAAMLAPAMPPAENASTTEGRSTTSEPAADPGAVAEEPIAAPAPVIGPLSAVAEQASATVPQMAAADNPEADAPTSVAPPAAQPAPATGAAQDLPVTSFTSYDEAKGYVAEQKKRGTSIQALPLQNEDGSFGVATKGTAQYAQAEAQKVVQDQRAAGILEGDILAKSGEPFKVKLPAMGAARRAGDGFVVAPVTGGFVVRKASVQAAPTTAQAAPGTGLAPSAVAPQPAANGVRSASDAVASAPASSQVASPSATPNQSAQAQATAGDSSIQTLAAQGASTQAAKGSQSQARTTAVGAVVVPGAAATAGQQQPEQAAIRPTGAPQGAKPASSLATPETRPADSLTAPSEAASLPAKVPNAKTTDAGKTPAAGTPTPAVGSDAAARAVPGAGTAAPVKAAGLSKETLSAKAAKEQAAPSASLPAPSSKAEQVSPAPVPAAGPAGTGADTNQPLTEATNGPRPEATPPAGRVAEAVNPTPDSASPAALPAKKAGKGAGRSTVRKAEPANAKPLSEASAPEAKMARDEITREMEAIGASGKARKEKAYRDSPNATSGAEIDYMTDDEKSRLYELKKMLPSAGEEAQDARSRIADKVAARRDQLREPAPPKQHTGEEVSRFSGQHGKGMAKFPAIQKARELNKTAAKGITYTAEEHGDAKLEHPFAVVGRKATKGVQQPAFRQGAAAEPTSKASEYRQHLSAALAKLAIPYAIHESVAEASASTGYPIPSNVNGAYFKGKLHLIASNLASPVAAEEVFWHEVNHAGIDAIYGDGSKQYENALRALAMQNANIREAAKAWMDKYGRDDYLARIQTGSTPERAMLRTKLQAVDEALAEMAGRNVQINGMARFIAAAQKFMRAIGLNKLADSLEGKSNAQALSLIATARRAVMGATPVPARGTNALMANRKDVVGESQGGRSADDETKGDTIELFHGSPDANLSAVDPRVESIFGGVFASTSRNAAASHTGHLEAGGHIYSAKIPRDSVLTQHDFDHELEPDRVKAALRKSMPWLRDEDYDAAYEAVIEDRVNDLDVEELARIFKAEIGEAGWEAQRIRGQVARNLGFKAVEMVDEHGTSYLILPGASLKPANESPAPNTGGATTGEGSDSAMEAMRKKRAEKPSFSRATMAEQTQAATDKVSDLFRVGVPGKLNWWHKSVGTMQNLALRSPEFKRVYDSVQHFINDVSYFATEAADLAPRILPKLETWKDIAKSPLSAQDTKAVSAPVFEGTLSWTRDASGKPARETDPQKAGIVWTDKELAEQFKLSPEQIGLYREFRAATDKSLSNLAISDMLRFAGKDATPIKDVVMEAASVADAADTLGQYLQSLAKEEPTRAAVLNDTADKIKAKAERAADLMGRGYAPLSRFGHYTLDVMHEGERVYFGMFESPGDARVMANKMRILFPGAEVNQGTVSQEAYKIFAGVSPETVELFGDMLGLEAQGSSAGAQAFQEFLKLARSNRSAMKRLIERKGIAGFSEDAGRVLAGFVYSNARQTSSNLHMGGMTDGLMQMKEGSGKNNGELFDTAAKLVEYIKNPQEEAQKLRGLLFAQYIGGSVASAMVNLTQPITMTLPWLSQYGGIGKAGKQMAAAVKDATRRRTGDAKLDAALLKAEEQGIVSPQEVHQLMAQAAGAGALKSGDGTKAGDAAAKASNALSKLTLAWGKVFSSAEQFNRRVTFIAAYRTALEQKMDDPAWFAAQAIAETQGVYNKGNKPAWARGAIGSTLFTFKQYSIAYVEMIHRMATRGGPEGRKAALYSMAILFLLSGAGGLPGADDLDDIISGGLQALGYNFDSKAARKAFLVNALGEGGAQFVERGVSGLGGVPIDVSGRLGMGNLFPGTGLLTKKADHTRDVGEFAGPAGDLASRVFKAGGKAFTGDLAGAANTIAPKAIQNLAQAYDMANMGMYRDQSGKKVLDTDGYDALAKAIGFQPNDVKRVQDATGEVQRRVALNKMRESEISAQWAQGLFEKDPDKVQAARDALAQWNTDNEASPIRINAIQIGRRVREMAMSKEDRIAKTAPKEIRASVRRELEATR